MPEIPNGLKRSLLLGQKVESRSLKDDVKQVFKRRKIDIRLSKLNLKLQLKRKRKVLVESKKQDVDEKNKM